MRLTQDLTDVSLRVQADAMHPISVKWKRWSGVVLLALASAVTAQSNIRTDRTGPYVGTDAAGNFHVNSSECTAHPKQRDTIEIALRSPFSFKVMYVSCDLGNTRNGIPYLLMGVRTADRAGRVTLHMHRSRSL